jgi:hypothetical protein
VTNTISAIPGFGNALSIAEAGFAGGASLLEDDPKEAAAARHIAYMKAAQAIPVAGNIMAGRDAVQDWKAFGSILSGDAKTPPDISFDRWDKNTGPIIDDFFRSLL